MKGMIFTAVFVVIFHVSSTTKDNQSLDDPSSGRVLKDAMSDVYESELERHQRNADKKRKLQIFEKTLKKQNQKTKPKQRSKQRVTRLKKKRKGKTSKKNKGKKRKGKKNKKTRKGNTKKKTKGNKKKGNKTKKKERQNNAVVEKKPYEGPYGYMHPEEIDVSMF